MDKYSLPAGLPSNFYDDSKTISLDKLNKKIKQQKDDKFKLPKDKDGLPL